MRSHRQQPKPDCPLHVCSRCGRHIALGRIVFRLAGAAICPRCVDELDLYDDLDQGGVA